MTSLRGYLPILKPSNYFKETKYEKFYINSDYAYITSNKLKPFVIK